MRVILAIAVLLLLSASPFTARESDANGGPLPLSDEVVDPARLQALQERCWREGREAGAAAGEPDLERVYECLVAAAVAEFDANLATEHFPTAEFETRLRHFAETRARFLVDLNVKHGRCDPCGPSWPAFEPVERAWAVEVILADIWEYYR